MTIYNVLSFLGGVGLFLYGMTIMSSGLRNAAGDKLRSILEKVAGNRVLAILIGILVTVLIQSSSATDMMVIGFVDSGLMNLFQAVGVIMGANIGTTVTAQITAFDLVSFAPFILFVGCVMAVFVKKTMVQHIGRIILGFGMLFVGIGILKAAIAPLSKSAEFVDALSLLSNPAAGILFGFLFTSLLQSSSSSIVIFQAFAFEGLLTYEQCVFLIIGAAVGSVTPNLLASLTTGRNGKRTALLNLYFNLLRAVLLTVIVLAFPAVLEWIKGLSPNDVARQVANTHTIFAVFAVTVIAPFSSLLVKLAQKTLPMLPAEMQALEDRRLKYLAHVGPRSIPAVAMRQAALEVTRMGRIARDNLETSLTYFFDPSQQALFDKVEETEETVDYLNKVIEDKLVELRSLSLSDRDVFRLSRMILVVANMVRGEHHRIWGPDEEREDEVFSGRRAGTAPDARRRAEDAGPGAGDLRGRTVRPAAGDRSRRAAGRRHAGTLRPESRGASDGRHVRPAGRRDLHGYVHTSGTLRRPGHQHRDVSAA